MENNIDSEKLNPHLFNFLKIRAKVNPSESEFKVRKAMVNIFPLIEKDLILSDSNLIGKSNNKSILDQFCQLISEQKIMDAARKEISKNISDFNSDRYNLKKISIHINKQVAYLKKISISSEKESPLGSITVEIFVIDQQLSDFINTYFPTYEMTTN